ncbi:MAG TPA: hypothetical protein VMT21_10700 [Gemmatimonadales bacterium]|nr:hypothetical protein [Gemmatimonadales bacterium]
MKIMSAVVGTLTLVALAACSESKLVVVDLNQPDQGRALQSASDVENLLTGQFRVIWNNTQGTAVSLEMQLECLGMESSTGLGNAESGKYCGIPRVPVDNGINNPSAINKYNPYLYLYRAARSSAIAINQMNQKGFTFVPADAAEFARDVAFGYFEIGVALGDVALVYDSGTVVAPGDNLSGTAPPYVGAATLMTAALGYLDSALAYGAQNPNGTNGWPAPGTWINGWDGSQATFLKLVHSWKARLRAGVARTPAERAAVDWTKVIADAQAGITSDFVVTMTTSPPNWAYDPSEINQGTTWSQMWQWMVGMADTSGNYSTYLSNTVNNGVFLVVTPDKRFPAGESRAAQNAASAGFSPNNGYPYIQNHVVSQDVTVSPEQTSQYNFWRFQQEVAASASNGPVPVMTVGEMNGLMAEGYLRAGNYAAAMTAINATRVPAGLPALAGIADTTTRVPGGNACVPKVPDPATSYKSAKCGNIWEAMKWEKRLEEAYTHWGAWWIDGRGWGDLPNGSVLEYPTPYQELQTRQLPIYSLTRLAAKGNYGL